MRSLPVLVVLWGILTPVRVSGQSPASGEDPAGPAGTEWRPSKTTPGVFFMPLLGDGAKPGRYVYRVRAPDGFRVPPHWHTQEVHLTILAGTLAMVMGASFDSTRAQRYGAGGFVAMPAGMRHGEWFEGETIIHVETEGPFETVFVDPRDDPRNRSQP